MRKRIFKIFMILFIQFPWFMIWGYIHMIIILPIYAIKWLFTGRDILDSSEWSVNLMLSTKK